MLKYTHRYKCTFSLSLLLADKDFSEGHTQFQFNPALSHKRRTLYFYSERNNAQL